MTEHCYLAVIGDIRGSRQLAGRSGIQTRLESALRELNGALPEAAVAARFGVTGGDAFQGLLSAPAAAVDALLVLEETMRPVTFRYGLGWGAVETAIRPRATEMDGPCFHRAREALEAGKAGDRWAVARGLGAEGDRVVTGILSLVGAVRERWTEKQAQTVDLARRLPTQREVASTLNVSPSTVSEALAAALYVPMCEAEAALASALRVFGSTPESQEDSVE